MTSMTSTAKEQMRITFAIEGGRIVAVHFHALRFNQISRTNSTHLFTTQHPSQ